MSSNPKVHFKRKILLRSPNALPHSKTPAGHNVTHRITPLLIIIFSLRFLFNSYAWHLWTAGSSKCHGKNFAITFMRQQKRFERFCVATNDVNYRWLRHGTSQWLINYSQSLQSSLSRFEKRSKVKFASKSAQFPISALSMDAYQPSHQTRTSFLPFVMSDMMSIHFDFVN